jgi:hypothetical protein
MKTKIDNIKPKNTAKLKPKVRVAGK